MIKRFKNFFKKTNDLSSIQYTQEELDNELFEAIEEDDFERFKNAILRGANINKIIPDKSGRIGYVTSPLIRVIYGWRYGAKDQYKFLKILFESGVELFGYSGNNKHYTFNIDIYTAINKLINIKYRQKVLDLLLVNYPNYMEERELRKQSDKYNL